MKVKALVYTLKVNVSKFAHDKMKLIAFVIFL